MSNKKILNILLVITFLLLSSFYLFSVPISKADDKLPDQEKYLSSKEVYTYNVSQFDSKATWTDLDWQAPTKGDFVTNPGGQIKVNFTRFGDKNPNDYSCFSAPLPYINIYIYENVSDALQLNFSLTDIPNSEAASNLAINYNSFLSGFLIPTHNLTKLKAQANDQVDSTGFMPGTVDIEETNCSIKFVFKADDRSQNVTMIYDKWVGILLWTKVKNIYGPDLEINLTGLSGYDIVTEAEQEEENEKNDDNKTFLEIPSYSAGIIVSIVLISSFLKKKKKKKIKI